jgi:hypothetical protein
MTKRTEWAHRVREAKAQMTMRMAAHMFSLRDTPMNRFIRKRMKVDEAEEYMDPELEHPQA